MKTWHVCNHAWPLHAWPLPAGYPNTIHERLRGRRSLHSRGKMAAAVTGTPERAESEITTCSSQPAHTAAPHREASPAEDLVAGFLEDRDTELMCPKTVGELMEHLSEQNNTLKEQVNETARRNHQIHETQRGHAWDVLAVTVTGVTLTAVNCVGNLATQSPS